MEWTDFYWGEMVMGRTDRMYPHLGPHAVDASGRKLNLRRDLRRVAKRTGKFPHKYMRVAKKTFQGRHILYFIG